jgi:hypothetical protein
MPKLTFYPLDNADCCLIDLDGGEKLIFDFGDQRDLANSFDLRVDLTQTIRDNFAAAKKDTADVLVFTHLDRDHYNRASALFWLDHDKAYQGEGRIRIKELWVPAAAILDDECEDEGKVLQAEARHRLIEGAGIRVFALPNALEDWLSKRGVKVADRLSCMVDAGTIVPTFNLATHGVEFFVHSPFGHRIDEGSPPEERNAHAIMVQATFMVGKEQTKLLLASDLHADALEEIAQITKSHGREERLEWDILKVPHHCSYRSLAEDGDKGVDKTVPLEEVAWIFEDQALPSGIVVCPSKPIPLFGDDVQPPHRQAANYYDGLPDSEFVVTMQHPTKTAPKPLVIEIDHTKARIERVATSASFLTGATAPRAGRAG